MGWRALDLATVRMGNSAARADGMGRAVIDHLAWMQQRNYAVGTVQGRAHYLRCFCAWCEERGLERPGEVSKQVLERYRQHLYHRRKENGEPLSFRQQYYYLHAVRIWFRWLARQNRILYNPASELEMPKLDRRLPQAVLSIEEVEEVMRQPNLADPLGLRDRAILEVLYSTAIRKAELIGLTVWDIDRAAGTLMVRQGKGHKDRHVPIGERALAWLDRYERDARPLMIFDLSQDTLFLTKRGEPLGSTGLGEQVAAYVRAGGSGKRGSCHLFRHTCATLMLEGGADIRYIQELLGHSSLLSTQVYTRVSIRKLKEVHERTHPGAQNRPQSRVGEVVSAEELLATLDAEATEELAELA